MAKIRASMKAEGGNIRKRNPRQTRLNIVNAALKLFSQKGLEGTSIRDISVEAGESLSTVYYYFDDKTDLYRSVIMETMTTTMGPILEAENDTSGDSIQRLKRLTSVYLKTLAENPEPAMMLLHAMVLVIEHGQLPFLGILRPRLGVIEDLIREGQENGEIKKVSPALASHSLLGTIIWFFFENFAAARVEEWPNKDISVKEYSDYINKMLIESLRK